MSLRARLLLGMTVIAVTLVFSAVVVARTTEARLVGQLDDRLRTADLPGGGGRGGPGGPQFSAFFFTSVDSDGDVGTIFVPEYNGETSPVPELDGERALQAADDRELFTVESQGSDLRYRVVAREHGGTVDLFGLPLDDVDESISDLIRLEAAVVLSILAVLALVSWWVIRLGVRPIKQMAATAGAIAGGDLSHRVPEADPQTEAGELGIALNGMLGRIEEAFDERARATERLRQFVADASHELRTPVTTIRGYAELYRKGGLDERAELDEAMRRTEQEALRMGTLVDDLLHLARLDQGRPLEQAPVDLSAVIDDVARDARAVEPEREITSTADESLVVTGDEGRLRQVVANLVGNARVHTPAGTPIEVRARRGDGVAVIEVVDHGDGMSPDVAARAFERFYRADPSRARHRGGSGLGLSIVQATVRAHGGDVAIDSAEGRGTTVRVTLPA